MYYYSYTRYLIEQDPMMVRSKSAFDGSLPLFHACAYNVGGTAAVRALHKLHPDATREMDNHGYRAINYAAAMGSEEVLRFLLQADSKSALYVPSPLLPFLLFLFSSSWNACHAMP